MIATSTLQYGGIGLPVPPPPAAPQAAAQPAPAPKPVAVPHNQELAEVLSPSQVSTWKDCGARGYFRYFLGLPDTIDAKRAMGLAVDGALSANFRQKIRSKKDLTREQILKIYGALWKHYAKQARFAQDDDPAEIEKTGAILVQKYLIEAAPEIIPIAVQQHVSGEIAGVKVHGYIDLLDSNGCIIDLKTAGRKPSGIRPDHAFQLATYAQITTGASGKVAIHTLVSTKTPQLVKQTETVSAEQRRHTQVMYPLVQASVRAGYYIPNRASMFCSRSSCAYWERCQTEFGGTVEE